VKQKLLDLVITAAVWFVVVAPLHEFWHYQTGTWLGGSGFYVTYPNFISGYCYWTVSPANVWLVYLMGGVGAGFMMLLLAWRALSSPTRWDEDDLFVLALFGGIQIGYGLGELSLAFRPDLFWPCAVAGSVLGSLPAALWRGPKLAAWVFETKSPESSP